MECPEPGARGRDAAGAAVLVGAGVVVSRPAVVVAGLAASILGPVRYGQRVAGQNHLSHHLVRGLAVIALAVVYRLS
jgi:hypothetical protein